MPVPVAVRHRTIYAYAHLVMLGPQTIRLRPAPHARTPIADYVLTVLPQPETRTEFQDPPGNFLTRVTFSGATRRFELEVSFIADVTEANPFDFFIEPEAACWPFRYSDQLEPELVPYLAAKAPAPPLAALLAEIPQHPQSSLDLLVALNKMVHGRVAYTTRMEAGVQGSETTLGSRTGSCRDVAWLLVELTRSLGFAARFASGYLIQLADENKPIAGLTQDTADLHAWAEVYLPGAGWIGFDATSGLMTGAGHIPLSSNAVPAAAAPISGTLEASEASFTVEMSARRLP